MGVVPALLPLVACLLPIPQEPETVLLEFRPECGAGYEVDYEEDSTWKYEEDFHGSLATRFRVAWTFEESDDSTRRGRGRFVQVEYRGEGVKNGTPWKHDILWNAEGGYVRGAGSDAARTWIDGELAEGLSYTVDRRGAAGKGPC